VANKVRSATLKVVAGLAAVIVLAVSVIMLTLTAARLDVATVDVGALPPASPPADMSISALPTGTYETPAIFAFRGGSWTDTRLFASTAVLVHHPKGNLLIDTGFGTRDVARQTPLSRSFRAMCGPAFDPDACLALPTAQIAVMGPDPAVNAVFYNRIHAIEDLDERAAFVAQHKAEYEEDVDLVHLAAELVVDAVVQPEDLRSELVRRLGLAASRVRDDATKRHGVPPV